MEIVDQMNGVLLAECEAGVYLVQYVERGRRQRSIFLDDWSAAQNTYLRRIEESEDCVQSQEEQIC
jgi:hypothetical protein